MALQDYSDAAFCRGCGYSLRALEVCRCPECGRGFDRHDPETMRVPGWRRPGRVVVPFGERTIKLATVGAYLILLDMGLGLCGAFEAAGWIVWIAGGVAWWAYGKIPEDDDRPRRWRAWTVGIVLFTLAATMRPSYYVCPHANTVFAWHAAVSYAPDGPCHNRPHNGGVRLFKSWYVAWRS